MNGIYNILKPPGMTSSDVVVRMKRFTGEKHVGHAGTLDPQAAGVLVVCTGRYTRYIDYLRSDKEYIAALTLGSRTDTQDCWGTVLDQTDIRGITKGQIEACFPRYTGTILQMPPMYSALKFQGQKLYELARKGTEVERKARQVEITELAYLSELNNNTHLIRVACSSGTYIRTLCQDIGTDLGCGAHMSFLIRDRVGNFDIQQSMTLEECKARSEEGTLEKNAIPLDEALRHIPALIVEEQYSKQVLNGLEIPFAAEEGLYRLSLSGQTIGLANVNEGKLKVKMLCL